MPFSSVEAKEIKITISAAQSAVRLAKGYLIPTINKRLTEKGERGIQWTEPWGSSLADFKDTFEAIKDNIA